jgi:hypothetical protein
VIRSLTGMFRNKLKSRLTAPGPRTVLRPLTAVVNQSLVHKYLGTEDPTGRLVKISGLEKIPNRP